MSLSRRTLLALMAQSVGVVSTQAVGNTGMLNPEDGAFRVAPSRRSWRIGFGSCAKQEQAQPIWTSIAATDPDLFVFLGDNFYADAQTESELRRRHEEFRQHAAVSRFRAKVPHIAIWDDHDYGVDDAGAEYPHRSLSQQLFCDTWRLPAESVRRQRPGVYGAYLLKDDRRTVQVILPDLRFNRSALNADESARSGYAALMDAARRGQAAPGWYRPVEASGATLLGEAQWSWLEARLRVPADLHIIGSSIQFAAEGTGWECWANFPQERQRLLDLISRHQVSGVLFISGDMHYGEVSLLDTEVPYPMWDITSSGLTETWAVPTPNRRRKMGPWIQRNFGMLSIDWNTRTITATIHDEGGALQLSQSISMLDLRMNS